MVSANTDEFSPIEKIDLLICASNKLYILLLQSASFPYIYFIFPYEWKCMVMWKEQKPGVETQVLVLAVLISRSNVWVSHSASII